MFKGKTQIRSIITCSIELNLKICDFPAGFAHLGAEKDCGMHLGKDFPVEYIFGL